MVRFTKETTRMGTDTGKVEKITVMERDTDTKEGGITIREKARECTRGLRDTNIRGNSRRATFMEMECIRGQMAEDI